MSGNGANLGGRHSFHRDAQHLLPEVIARFNNRPFAQLCMHKRTPALEPFDSRLLFVFIGKISESATRNVEKPSPCCRLDFSNEPRLKEPVGGFESELGSKPFQLVGPQDRHACALYRDALLAAEL